MWPFNKNITNTTSTLSDPKDWLLDFFNNVSGSGASVTPDTALRQATVFACIRVLSSTIAALPFHLMKSEGNTRGKAKDHPLYSILHDLPNEEIVSYNYFQTKYTDAFLLGTAFSEISRDGRGRVGEIWPLDSSQMMLSRNKSTSKLTYSYGPEQRIINPENIWRITGFSDNRHGHGIIGRSPMELFRDAIGQTLTGEEYISELLKNGGVSKIALEVAHKLNKEQREEIRAGWNEKQQGSKNSGNVSILHNGAKLKELSMSAADAQLMEFLGLKKKDICGIWGVPPHLIGADSDVKYSNMEQQNISFLVHGLLPIIKSGEQTVYRDLLNKSERKNHYAKYNLAALLRADTKTRGEFYRLLLNIGVLTVNEIRDFEELNPVDGGDNRYMQLNMGLINKLGEITGGNNESKSISKSNTEE